MLTEFIKSRRGPDPKQRGQEPKAADDAPRALVNPLGM